MAKEIVMETEEEMPQLQPYQRLKSPEMQCKIGVKYTILKIASYTLAVLNLIASLIVFVLVDGFLMIGIVDNAFRSVPHSDVAYVMAVLRTVICAVTSILWIVMVGYFIKSLAKKKRIRAPIICCRQMLHTIAVWIIVLRLVLISTVHLLDPMDFEGIFYTIYIEPVLNVLFIVIYYFYAVKLNFGLMAQDSDMM